jgi:hypothetical protein
MQFTKIRGASPLNCLLLTLAFTFQACAASPAEGQATTYSRPYEWDKVDCSTPNFADLFVDSFVNGSASLRMIICVPAAHEAEVRDELPAALGCSREHLQISRFEDEGLIGLDATCNAHFSRRRLVITGQADVRSIQEVLRKENIASLAVLLWLPLTPNTNCDPRPSTKAKYLPRTMQCVYILSGASSEPHIIRFAFGYDGALVWRAVAILGGLLLLPSVALVTLRRRALRMPQSNPYRWPNFIVPIYLFFFVWMRTATWLHAPDFVMFVIPPSDLSGATQRVVGVLLALLVPPVLVSIMVFSLWSLVRNRSGAKIA